MITHSFIPELYYIAQGLKQTVKCELQVGEFDPLKITVEGDIFSVEFLNKLIWKESIGRADSSFGVESCDTIYKIMKRVKDGQPWEEDFPHIHI